jgi:hypothetical protein
VKWLVAFVVTCGVLSASASMASASQPFTPPDAVPPDTVPIDPVPIGPGDSVPSEGGSVSNEVGPPVLFPVGSVGAGPLQIVPSGCVSPRPAAVVFVGLMLAKDARTARFRLEQVRAGSAKSYAVTDLIDVRFDDDVRFLTTNETYLVGAAPLDGNLVLASKVRDTKPLFGGNSVIGINDKTLDCPTLDDPVRTLHVDGSPIDSGIFNGLKAARRDLLVAVAKPVAWAFGIILVLALLRWLLVAMLVVVRRAVDGDPIESSPPSRQHHSTR